MCALAHPMQNHIQLLPSRMYPRNSVNEATGATLRSCKKSIHGFLIERNVSVSETCGKAGFCERATNLKSWIAATKSKDFNGAAVATTAPSPFLLLNIPQYAPSSPRSFKKFLNAILKNKLWFSGELTRFNIAARFLGNGFSNLLSAAK